MLDGPLTFTLPLKKTDNQMPSFSSENNDGGMLFRKVALTLCEGQTILRILVGVGI